MKIILIGFMGSGKTTVGKHLSTLLQLPLLEMDDRVLEMTKTKSMHELFALGGERLLRDTELAVASEYAPILSAVISTGGGIIMNRLNLDYLKTGGGAIIYLKCPLHTIQERL